MLRAQQSVGQSGVEELEKLVFVGDSVAKLKKSDL
jgi:hypothetical protein